MSIKMKEKEYPIVAVIWEDHASFFKEPLPPDDDLSDYIRPSLTVGLLYKKTRKYIILIHHLERYQNDANVDFMVIYKNAILGMQEYGNIKIENLHTKGD